MNYDRNFIDFRKANVDANEQMLQLMKEQMGEGWVKMQEIRKFRKNQAKKLTVPKSLNNSSA